MKRIGENAFIITFVVLLMLTIISFGVSNAANYSNETLNGAWLLIPSNEPTAYFIGDGSGGISELSLFNTDNPPGSYQVQSNGSLNISFNLIGWSFSVFGTLTSSTEGTVEGTGVYEGETANIYKVTDLSVCEGEWTGTLNTLNISFVVNSNGTVTSFSGLQPPVSGHMFYESGYLVAFFKTGSHDSFNQVGFRGSLSGNTITGNFEVDNGEGSDGTVFLTRGGGSILADFAADVISGAAPLTVNFTDQSTGTVDSWNWSFGDGSTSNEQNPSHTYKNLGSYTVTLTVTGPTGSNTETKSDYIKVSHTKAMPGIPLLLLYD